MARTVFARSLVWIAVAVLCALAATAVAAQEAVTRVAPVRPGTPFPAGVYDNLNGAPADPPRIDLAQVLGKKPVVLFYWIPNHVRSERVLQQVQALATELGTDRMAFYAVAVPRPHVPVETIRDRAAELKITVPVLSDEGFRIGQMLQLASVPNLTIIDRDGTLRLINGASLEQVVGYETDMEKVIRRVADKGDLMTYGYLDRYYPVKELEGSPCPDFKAPLLSTSVEQRFHQLLDDKKVNVLIFWSVDCPHCRESLPEINEWLAQNPEGVNVVSAASVSNDAIKAKTREFCELNEFQFPTLVDRNAEVGALYKVTSTPTILIIGPDGVVDSVILSGHGSFGKTVEEKKRKLLGSPG